MCSKCAKVLILPILGATLRFSHMNYLGIHKNLRFLRSCKLLSQNFWSITQKLYFYLVPSDLLLEKKLTLNKILFFNVEISFIFLTNNLDFCLFAFTLRPFARQPHSEFIKQSRLPSSLRASYFCLPRDGITGWYHNLS